MKRLKIFAIYWLGYNGVLFLTCLGVAYGLRRFSEDYSTANALYFAAFLSQFFIPFGTAMALLSALLGDKK